MNRSAVFSLATIALLAALGAGCTSAPTSVDSRTSVNSDCVEGAVSRSDLPNLTCGRRQKPIVVSQNGGPLTQLPLDCYRQEGGMAFCPTYNAANTVAR